MSRYLIDTIEATPNIDVRLHGEVAAAHGDASLERITVRDTGTGETDEVSLAAMFVFIGARPQTDWLPDGSPATRAGFVLAGARGAARGGAAALAARSRPVPARDEHARRLRRGRRAQRVDEAGRLCGRRGVDGRPASCTSTWRPPYDPRGGAARGSTCSRASNGRCSRTSPPAPCRIGSRSATSCSRRARRSSASRSSSAARIEWSRCINGVDVILSEREGADLRRRVERAHRRSARRQRPRGHRGRAADVGRADLPGVPGRGPDRDEDDRAADRADRPGRRRRSCGSRRSWPRSARSRPASPTS